MKTLFFQTVILSLGILFLIPNNIVAQSKDLAISFEVPDKILNSDLSVKIAILIGNSDYETFSKCASSSRDVDSMSHVLTQLDYNVYDYKNLERNNFLDSINFLVEGFRDSKIESFVFYYSGHGFSFRGQDFLVPVDVDHVKSIKEISNCIKVAEIINIISSLNAPTIAIIDAGSNDVGVNSNDGEISSRLPFNTENLFFASISMNDSNTYDGNVFGLQNSVFTHFLKNHLVKGGEVTEIFSSVSEDVYSFTEDLAMGPQIIYVQNTMIAGHSFINNDPNAEKILLNGR